jgi:hypothetical protein
MGGVSRARDRSGPPGRLPRRAAIILLGWNHHGTNSAARWAGPAGPLWQRGWSWQLCDGRARAEQPGVLSRRTSKRRVHCSKSRARLSEFEFAASLCSFELAIGREDDFDYFLDVGPRRSSRKPHASTDQLQKFNHYRRCTWVGSRVLYRDGWEDSDYANAFISGVRTRSNCGDDGSFERRLR